MTCHFIHQAVTVKTPDLLEGTVYAEDTAEFPKGSVVRTIEVSHCNINNNIGVIACKECLLIFSVQLFI